MLEWGRVRRGISKPGHLSDELGMLPTQWTHYNDKGEKGKSSWKEAGKNPSK